MLDRQNFNGSIYYENIGPTIKLPRGNMITALTPREKEACEHLKKGMSNEEIADEMKIAPNTAKQYLSNIFKKYGVKNRLKLLWKLRQEESENDLPPAA